MPQIDRQQVYSKHSGHCAYCGKTIQFSDMQVDHIISRHMGGTNNIKNLNPSCGRCNHYKRSGDLEYFRTLLITLEERLRDIYIFKVAEDYGIVKIQKFDGIFYFEKVKEAQ